MNNSFAWTLITSLWLVVVTTQSMTPFLPPHSRAGKRGRRPETPLRGTVGDSLSSSAARSKTPSPLTRGDGTAGITSRTITKSSRFLQVWNRIATHLSATVLTNEVLPEELTHTAPVHLVGADDTERNELVTDNQQNNHTQASIVIHTYLDTHNKEYIGLNVPLDKFQAFLDYQLGSNNGQWNITTHNLPLHTNTEERAQLRHHWRQLWMRQQLVTERTELLAVYPSDKQSHRHPVPRGGFDDLLHMYTERLVAIMQDEREEEESHDEIELRAWLRKQYGSHEIDRLLPHNVQDLSRPEQLQRWKAFLEWFRREFPYFYDRCDACGASRKEEPKHDKEEQTTFVGYVYPNDRELQGKASRTELYHCHKCGHMTRFPRFNAARYIMDSRRGRCGEYSMLLFRFLRALGHDCRWVVDWADHVWAEISIDREWIHMDPCEAAVSEPLIYQGWGKKQTYILGFYPSSRKLPSVPMIQDVTQSYTTDTWEEICQRRDESERDIMNSIEKATRGLRSKLP